MILYRVSNRLTVSQISAQPRYLCLHLGSRIQEFFQSINYCDPIVLNSAWSGSKLFRFGFGFQKKLQTGRVFGFFTKILQKYPKIALFQAIFSFGSGLGFLIASFSGLGWVQVCKMAPNLSGFWVQVNSIMH